MGVNHAINSATRSHGMDPINYTARFIEQGGVCAICKEPPRDGRCLQWDHDHRHCPGKHGCPRCVRDLLCGPCNRILGLVEKGRHDDFIAYLAKWSKRIF